MHTYLQDAMARRVGIYTLCQRYTTVFMTRPGITTPCHSLCMYVGLQKDFEVIIILNFIAFHSAKGYQETI